MAVSETDARTGIAAAVGVVAALAGATALVAALEAGLRLDNASSVYLVAVAVVAIRWGTLPAIIAALGGFLVYNLLFVEPRNTFAVASPEELLNLLLLLFVGVVIGRLAGSQRDRERVAQRREREARAQFAITRELATAPRLPQAMQAVVERIGRETWFRRIWIGLGPTVVQERVAADTAPGLPMPAIGTHAVLHRDRDESAAVWTRINPSRGVHEAADGLYRVELRADDVSLGSLWVRRDRADGNPLLEETRLLAAAADQIAQALRRDRLATRTADLEIERRSDELRSALLDSVSHDLRTPLASIRAAAGGLADPAIEPDLDEVRSTARTIDEEAERLNRLVGTLLDMSRIQAGALVAEIDVIPLSELVEPAVARMRSQLADHSVTVDLPPDLPSVRADATLLSQALSNLLENAVRHTPRGSPIAIRAASHPDRGVVTLVVEDGGAGVPAGGIAAPVRAVLPRTALGWRWRPAGIRARPFRRGGVGGGDGRNRARRPEQARRPGDHARAARRQRTVVTDAIGLRLLLVEDDEPTRRAVAANLAGHGYEVREAPDGEEALRLWEQGRPDLVLLDLGLPGIDGLAVVRRIRREATTPIIILSALDQERDKVAALDAGADDYLTKPFGMAELQARVRAAMRRVLGPDAGTGGQVRIGPLELDPTRRRVTINDEELHLTPREYELLKALIANAGRVVSRGRLLRAVWGVEYANESHYLHVHVAGIRRRIASADPEGYLADLIVAEPGVGYRVRDAEDLAAEREGS